MDPFNHPVVKSEVVWNSPVSFNIIWTDRETGEHAGSFYAELRDREGGGRDCVIFTMSLQEPYQNKRVLRTLCLKMPGWLREHGVDRVVIPRPDGGGDISDRAFERAGFEKYNEDGMRVASMLPDPKLGRTKVEALAAAEGGTLDR